MPTQQVVSQLNRVTLGGSTAIRSKLKIVSVTMGIFVNNHLLLDLLSAQEGPPLMSALTSGRYHIKWTQLADFPVPLHDLCAAVQHHKIYVTSDSPVEEAKHQIYMYTDQWSQLPQSGHYYGIPHIIGGRLAIIGGRLSATKKMTNKVSTFDEDTQTWTNYYPDLLSVRSRPGVVSHLEHVIVAGGGLDDITHDILKFSTG